MHPARVESDRHRLLERAGHHAGMRAAGQALVVLLEEEATAHRAWLPVRRLELHLEPEQVRVSAAEAELVVGERQRDSSWRST